MDILNKIKKLGFKITWKFIKIGFKSNTIFENQLNSSDVLSFALEQLYNSQNEDVENLACEYLYNIDKIEFYLNKLADKEKSDYEIEFRKWRVFYVINNLPDQSYNCVHGLCALGDIWCALGFPKDSPHIYQGIGNSLSPTQYYTDENYEMILKRHIDWIAKEISVIKENQ